MLTSAAITALVTRSPEFDIPRVPVAGHSTGRTTAEPRPQPPGPGPPKRLVKLITSKSHKINHNDSGMAFKRKGAFGMQDKEAPLEPGISSERATRSFLNSGFRRQESSSSSSKYVGINDQDFRIPTIETRVNLIDSLVNDGSVEGENKANIEKYNWKAEKNTNNEQVVKLEDLETPITEAECHSQLAIGDVSFYLLPTVSEFCLLAAALLYEIAGRIGQPSYIELFEEAEMPSVSKNISCLLFVS
ncbi:unnamed protein product [Protopolystoma xenopodis]|uniref:Uncharacterized protein n=1 Tax=Protopolystoma xenopodis TaxID=117903 RepID=A0A448WED4_9PLAT|nr:unnamed protein product [Protopolystoma xenopodis]